MNTLQILAPACLVVLSACSASSSGTDPVTTPGADSGSQTGSDSGTGSSSGSSSGGMPALKDPAECAHTSGCYGCCVADFQGGAQFYRIAELQCVCGGTGSCSGACTAEECSLLSSSSRACEDCMQARRSATCDQQAASACATDALCKTYMQCLSGCQ